VVDDCPSQHPHATARSIGPLRRSIDTLKKELEDIEQKLGSARKAAEALDATERDKSDLKLIEQECVAIRQKLRRAENDEGSDKGQRQPADGKGKLDKKLDEALQDTFPTSDPVSVAQPAPVKEHDRKLPEVQFSEQQVHGERGRS
jgi:hypothetical protein